MTRNAIVDALGVLKAGRIVDLTHLVHPGIQQIHPRQTFHLTHVLHPSCMQYLAPIPDFRFRVLNVFLICTKHSSCYYPILHLIFSQS